MSYGVGRPAILRFDESIRDCRLVLRHPLSIEDDMRLVSTVELMVIREKVHNRLAPLESSISDDAFMALREADMDFRTWFEQWDQRFSQKYSDVSAALCLDIRRFLLTMSVRRLGSIAKACRSNKYLPSCSTTLLPCVGSIAPRMSLTCLLHRSRSQSAPSRLRKLCWRSR
jgi:hypothetical protein